MVAITTLKLITMAKKESGKSTLTTVVSFRLLNKDYRLLSKRVGKKNVNKKCKELLTKYALGAQWI